MPTNWLVVGVTLTVAVILGRYLQPKQRWLDGAAFVLATMFALGLAFPNYWFLIMGLMAIGLMMSARAKSQLDATTHAVET
jgi:chromate transport protein ChrA